MPTTPRPPHSPGGQKKTSRLTFPSPAVQATDPYIWRVALSPACDILLTLFILTGRYPLMWQDNIRKYLLHHPDYPEAKRRMKGLQQRTAVQSVQQAFDLCFRLALDIEGLFFENDLDVIRQRLLKFTLHDMVPKFYARYQVSGLEQYGARFGYETRVLKDAFHLILHESSFTQEWPFFVTFCTGILELAYVAEKSKISSELQGLYSSLFDDHGVLLDMLSRKRFLQDRCQGLEDDEPFFERLNGKQVAIVLTGSVFGKLDAAIRTSDCLFVSGVSYEESVQFARESLATFRLRCLALSEPNRVIILRILSPETSATQLCKLLGLSKATVSSHLKTLEEAGFVSWNQAGTKKHYQTLHDNILAFIDEQKTFLLP